jgi:predicted transposase YbfD/YdcC
MGCQKTIAEKITQKGGDYLFSLKGNQSTLQESVEEIFRRTETSARERYQIDEFSEEKTKHHGRQEQRACRVVYRKKQKESWGFVDPNDEWKTLETLIRVNSYRKNRKTGKEEQEERFYISSSKKSAENILLATRKHWHIENKLHWVLDVQFGEDQAQKRERNAAANVSILRRAAINLMKKDKTFKNTRRARVHAILKTEFMEKLLWGTAL